jgi:hypothetical protein
MTIETRTTVEPRDIQTVEFECKKCNKVSSWPIGKITQPPTSCECGVPHSTHWMSPGGDTFTSITHLLDAIKRLAAAEAGEHFRIRFGVNGIEREMRKSS